jgi:hypothetical protein
VLAPAKSGPASTPGTARLLLDTGFGQVMKRARLVLFVVPVLFAGAAGPASASTWASRQLAGEAGQMTMFGISCPTASLCVAAGSSNTIASSTNPGGGPASWNATGVGAGSNGAPNQDHLRSPGSGSAARRRCPTA